MYLRGLGKLVEDAAGNVYDDGTIDAPDSGGFDQGGMPTYPPSTSDSGPTIDSSWMGVLGDALKTWGLISVEKVRGQTQVGVAQANARYMSPYYYGSGVRPVAASSPFVATGGAASLLVPLALIGGAAYLLLK